MNIAVPFEAPTSKIKLSKKSVEAIIAAHPSGHRGRYWFADQPGLFLSISKGGCASYCLRYPKLSGKDGDYTIGRASVITPQEASEKARDSLAKLTLHHLDPLEARLKARQDAQTAPSRTLRALCTDFFQAAEIKALVPRTIADWDWLLEKHILPELGDTDASEITRRQVKDLLRAIQGGASQRVATDPKAGNRTANKAHGLIRRIYNWAIDDDRLENNPGAFKKMFDDRPSKRVGALDEGRIKAIWEAIEKEAAEEWGVASLLAIQLCFVTLQRPNEVCNARAEQFDWDAKVWRIPEDLTKTNAFYEVPLSEMAIGLFKRAFTESGSKWAFVAQDGKSALRPSVLSHRFAKLRGRLVKTELLATADIELYDARRFGRTYIEHTLGFPDHVAEGTINHAGDQSMKRRYDVGDHSGAIRRAHEAWAEALQAIITGQQAVASNVVRLGAR